MTHSGEARKEIVERYFYPRRWRLLGIALTSFVMFWCILLFGANLLDRPFALSMIDVYRSFARKLMVNHHARSGVVIGGVLLVFYFSVGTLCLYFLTIFNHQYLERMKVISKRRNRSTTG